jgi:hypothetical protein
MFWCTAPFLVATIVLLPLLAQPPEITGRVILGVVVLLCFFVLIGLWNAERFWWCWRAVGGIIACGYLVYLVAMIAEGQWFVDGRRSSATAFNALLGLIVFGYPGFMYALFGRLSWKPELEYDDHTYELTDTDELDPWAEE